MVSINFAVLPTERDSSITRTSSVTGCTFEVSIAPCTMRGDGRLRRFGGAVEAVAEPFHGLGIGEFHHADLADILAIGEDLAGAIDAHVACVCGMLIGPPSLPSTA